MDIALILNKAFRFMEMMSKQGQRRQKIRKVAKKLKVKKLISF
jgi:hypothetical protein